MKLQQYKQIMYAIAPIFMGIFIYGTDEFARSRLPGNFSNTSSDDTQKRSSSVQPQPEYDERKAESIYATLRKQFGYLEEAIRNNQKNAIVFHKNIQDKISDLKTWLLEGSQARRELFDWIAKASDPSIYKIIIKNVENKQIVQNAIDELQKFEDPNYQMSSVGEFSIVGGSNFSAADIGRSVTSVGEGAPSLQTSAVVMTPLLERLKTIVTDAENRASFQSDIKNQVKFVVEWPKDAQLEKIVALQLLGAYYLDQALRIKASKGEGQTSKFNKVIPVSDALRQLKANLPSIYEEGDAQFYKIYTVGFLSSKQLEDFDTNGEGNILEGFCKQLTMLKRALKKYKGTSQKISVIKLRNTWQWYRAVLGICNCLQSKFEFVEVKKMLDESDDVIRNLNEKIKKNNANAVSSSVPAESADIKPMTLLWTGSVKESFFNTRRADGIAYIQHKERIPQWIRILDKELQSAFGNLQLWFDPDYLNAIIETKKNFFDQSSAIAPEHKSLLYRLAFAFNQYKANKYKGKDSVKNEYEMYQFFTQSWQDKYGIEAEKLPEIYRALADESDTDLEFIARVFAAGYPLDFATYETKYNSFLSEVATTLFPSTITARNEPVSGPTRSDENARKKIPAWIETLQGELRDAFGDKLLGMDLVYLRDILDAKKGFIDNLSGLSIHEKYLIYRLFVSFDQYKSEKYKAEKKTQTAAYFQYDFFAHHWPNVYAITAGTLPSKYALLADQSETDLEFLAKVFAAGYSLDITQSLLDTIKNAFSLQGTQGTPSSGTSGQVSSGPGTQIQTDATKPTTILVPAATTTKTTTTATQPVRWMTGMWDSVKERIWSLGKRLGIFKVY